LSRVGVLAVVIAFGCHRPLRSAVDGNEAGAEAPVEDAESVDAVESVESSSRDGPRSDVGPPMPSCGGTVTTTGSTPLGAFDATDVNVQVIFTCNSIDVRISDVAIARQLSFSLHPAAAAAAADAGADSILGSQTSNAALTSFQTGGSLLATTAVVTVQAVGDPFGGTPANPGPSGTLQATFTLDQDGFALSGSFSSPYCSTITCQH